MLSQTTTKVLEQKKILSSPLLHRPTPEPLSQRHNLILPNRLLRAHNQSTFLGQCVYIFIVGCLAIRYSIEVLEEWDDAGVELDGAGGGVAGIW